MHVSRTLALLGFWVAWLVAASACGDDGAVTDGAVTDGAVADGAPDAAPGSCSLPCPVPTTNKNTICGQLVDFETNAPIAMADPTGRDCDDIPVGERTGPCLLLVALYDMLGFAQNPTGTPPQAVDSITINDCGRYAAFNASTPALGFLGVAVDDADDSPNDDRVVTAVVFPAAPGERRVDQPAYAVAATTDAAWTATAGDPFGGATFASEGVAAEIFLYQGAPVAGVTLDGVDPANDYYFSDTDPWTHSTIDPAQNATGPNGLALAVKNGLVAHGGTGGLPDECQWPTELRKSIPAVVLIQTLLAEDATTGDPCGE